MDLTFEKQSHYAVCSITAVAAAAAVLVVQTVDATAVVPVVVPAVEEVAAVLGVSLVEAAAAVPVVASAEVMMSRYV